MNYPGTEMRFSVSFTLTDTGAAADPTTLVLKLKDASGTVTSYTYGSSTAIVNDSVGNYHGDVIIPSSGKWSWRWEATGAVVGATEGTFIVKETAFA